MVDQADQVGYLDLAASLGRVEFLDRVVCPVPVAFPVRVEFLVPVVCLAHLF